MKPTHVFLGGTCANNPWRENIVIPALLERGVDIPQIFNPVVEHWTPADQAREDEAKDSPNYLLVFVLASPDPATPNIPTFSPYSLCELIMALYDKSERTVALIDTSGMERSTAKRMAKTLQDLRQRFPEGAIFAGDDYIALADYVARRLHDA